MDNVELCSPCIIVEPIIETQEIPTTLCPCVIPVPEIVVVKKQLTNYCLHNFLTEIVYMKNCNRPQKGC